MAHIVKAAQRRALDRALRSKRCPSCNRSGRTYTVSDLGLCGACGASFQVEATFDKYATSSGFHWIVRDISLIVEK